MTVRAVEGSGRDKDLVSEMEADLRRRLHLVPQPRQGFDPLHATADELALYGLPPRPDPDIQREAYALWHKLLSPPLLIVPTEWPVFRTIDYRLSQYQLLKQLGPTGHDETSENWSGAVISANGSSPFTTVYGSWLVPTPALPTGGPDGDYRCSTWLGLDGVRRHSPSLPQLGTLQRVVVSGGTPTVTVEAWWQWWIRGANRPPVPFPTPFVVNPGDPVICSLTVIAPNKVQFLIKNQTPPGQLARYEADAPELPWPLSFDLPVRGRNAEWIAERPMMLGSTVLYPLPDYGSVTFGDCLAIVPPEVRNLSGARLLRMVEVRESPHRATIISSASKIGPTQNVVQASYRYEGT